MCRRRNDRPFLTKKAREIMSDLFFYGMTFIGFIVVAYLIKNF